MIPITSRSSNTSKVEDPFACFGSDSSCSSEDDKEEEEEEEEKKPTTIIWAAETRQRQQIGAKQQVEPSPPWMGLECGGPTTSSSSSATTSISISTAGSTQPLYVSPLIAIQSTADTTTSATSTSSSTSTSTARSTGGRGYFAIADRIPPGTLLLVEKPLMTWPEEQIGKPLSLVSVLHALQQPNAHDIIQAFAVLHPTKVYLEELLLQHIHHKTTAATPPPTTTKTDDTMDQRIVQLYQSYYKQYAKSNILRRIQQLGTQIIIQHERRNNEQEQTQRQDRFTGTDAIRMLLVLRLNAFQTGAYLYMSMFNHSCQPNCTKFTPSADTFQNDHGTSSTIPSRHNNQYNDHHHYQTSPPHLSCYSQIWTTQWITKGQELTLFYLHPRELAHATRRLRFWEQHLLDIDTEDITTSSSTTTSMHNNLMEMVHGSIPSSILPPVSTMLAHEQKQRKDNYMTKKTNTNGSCIVTSTIEETLADWEVQYLQIDNEINSLPSLTTKNDELHLYQSALKELEKSAMEFCHKAGIQLHNPYHILMIRCYRLHTDCAILYLNHILRPLLLQQHSATEATAVGTTSLVPEISEETHNSTAKHYIPRPISSKVTEREVSNVGCRCILNLYNLLYLQVQLLGEHHCDIGRTYYDLWNEIGHVLSSRGNITKLNQLIAEIDTYPTSTNSTERRTTKITNPKVIRTFTQWSKEEDRCRREYERIRKLYPNDIEPIILQNCSFNAK